MKPMRGAGSHYRAGGSLTRALLGWTIATMIVLIAVFGPPLTRQRIPAMIEIRHDVLMIDREFERWTMPPHTSFGKHAYKIGEASHDS